MPSAQKVSWAQLRVGVMAVVAMIILGVLIFLLTGSKKLFAKHETIYTYLGDSAALAKGAPVRLNGIAVGSVKEISLSGERNPRRIIKLKLEVDREMLQEIPVDSIASIAAENLLGTKYINIKKGLSGVPVQPGAEVQSLNTAGFDDVVAEGYATLTSLKTIVERVDAIVGLIEAGKGSIGKLLVDEELYNKVLAIVNEGQKVTSALNSSKGTIGKLLNDDTLYRDVRGSLARLDTMMDDLQQGKGTAGKLLKDEALYSETRQTLADLRKTIDQVNSGKGTVGKLLNSDELHNQLTGSLAKMDLMIDKLNAGQGTIGQLLVNPQLYDTMNGATRELQSLFKDIRANPKKFLRIKLAIF
ncbi:MAG TPA: MlaD family protein [Bryobacteraceae bacterium]|nr:MlaD family protein [Bryobacteraceae bacterium]